MCSDDPNGPPPAPEEAKKILKTYRVVIDVQMDPGSCEVKDVKFVKANNIQNTSAQDVRRSQK